MPKGGIDIRAQQIELLSSLVHKEKTSKKFEQTLSKLINMQTGEIIFEVLDSRKRAALREWRNDLLLNKKLPNDFIKTFAKITSKASNQWVKAKKTDSFKTFLPYLKQIIPLVQQKAHFIGWKDHPYDALLQLYEPGMTTKTLDALFAELKPFLTNLSQQLIKKTQPNAIPLLEQCPKEKQKEFHHDLLKTMGFDHKHARLDYSEHPFCSGLHPCDVRITTNMSSWSFLQSVYATIHEGGHALYELGLPSNNFGSPLGSPCSFGIHESQSLWWESYIGKSFPFLQYMFLKLKKSFPQELSSITFNHFYQAINSVKPSLIRVSSDEITYILHIILRYEIEKAFLEKACTPSTLPTVWKQKTEAYLGITPSTDSDGCLQDIHWSLGLFGYFPTYALGKIYSGQIFHTFQKTFSDWDTRIANGDFDFVRHFLSEHIYRFGREFPPLTLIKRITGTSLSSKPFMNYLTNKFTPQ